MSIAALDPNGTSSPTRDEARTIPADIAAERALIGAGLLDEGAAHVVAGVDPSAWYVEQHREIAAAIATVLDEGGRSDVVTVADAARRAGHTVDAVDLQLMLVEVPSVSSAGPHYAPIVERHARHRRLVELADQLSAAAMEGRDDRLEDIARRISDEVDR